MKLCLASQAPFLWLRGSSCWSVRHGLLSHLHTNTLKLPQLWENYKSQSADAISIAFLIVWFFGDVTNFAGAVWAGLVPTVVALGLYFCIADVLLITQCLYYNFINARQKHLLASTADGDQNEGILSDDPSRPLLNRPSTDNIGLPGSRRRSSASRRRRSSTLQSEILPIIKEEESALRVSLKNTLAILGVCLIGTVGWTVAWQSGWWMPMSAGHDVEEPPRILGAELLGYVSAVCYLGYLRQVFVQEKAG